MYLSPASISATAGNIQIAMLKRPYHETLGIIEMCLGNAGTLYLDFDSAMAIKDNLTKILDEYLDSDVATYNTATLDPSEVE